MTTNNLISPMKFCYNTSFTLPKQSKDLDLSNKMDLDFWDCFGWGKTPSYNRRNTVIRILQNVVSHLPVHFIMLPL